jgi:hypothetical protein
VRGMRWGSYRWLSLFPLMSTRPQAVGDWLTRHRACAHGGIGLDSLMYASPEAALVSETARALVPIAARALVSKTARALLPEAAWYLFPEAAWSLLSSAIGPEARPSCCCNIYETAAAPSYPTPPRHE